MRPRQTRLRRIGSTPFWTRCTLAGLLIALASCSDTPASLTDPPAGDGNRAPVASAGADLAVSANLPVQLDGSQSSDPDGDPITYSWTLTPPAGSAAALDEPTSETPSFTPDVAGQYTVALVVNDGKDDSAADGATITAEDNTVSQTVGAAGGNIASSDGLLTLTVPAGALTGDTELSITPVSEAQVPESLRDLPGDATVYDLQPSGLRFAVATELAITVPAGVIDDGNTVGLRAAFLLSESNGVVEALGNLSYEASDTDPTDAVLTGELTHFSNAILLEFEGAEFSAELPDSAAVDEPFQVTVTIDIEGAGLGVINQATQEEASVTPVEAATGFDETFSGSNVVQTSTNTYSCTEAGVGLYRVIVGFESNSDLGPIIATTLSAEVRCIPALETSFVSAFRAQNLTPVPGQPDLITLGGGVRKLNVATAVLAQDLENPFPTPGDFAEYVNLLPNGDFLVHTLLGQVSRVVDADPATQDSVVNVWDQPRDVHQISADVVAVASAFGDYGLLREGQPFTDAFRDLTVLGGPQQQPNTNLQQVWVAEDGETVIGIITTGDGDSAFEPSILALIDADETTGLVAANPVDGDVLDVVLDQQVRHQLELECHLVSSLYLCVITSGFDGPAFDSPLDDLETDGLLEIFTLDVLGGTATSLYSSSGNARVGGGVFPSDDGLGFVVAAANQFESTVELWRVDPTGGSFEVTDMASVSIANECRYPVDLVSVDSGYKLALACQTPAFSAQSGVLIIHNLQAAIPGF